MSLLKVQAQLSPWTKRTRFLKMCVCSALSVLAVALMDLIPSQLRAEGMNVQFLHVVNTQVPRRISTTKTVSNAMREIRTIVRNNHSLVTHRRLGVEQAQMMAKQVKKQITAIRESNASAALRKRLLPILKNIESGVSAIALPTEKLSRMEGLFQMDRALTNYEKLVTDPEWTELRVQ